MAQYGAPNPVYEANNTPLVNRGQQNMNQMRGMQGGGFNQPQQPGMFEGWGAGKYLMGPGAWLGEYMKPGMMNNMWEGVFGGPDEIQKIPNFDEEQMSALSQLLQHGLGNINQFDFAPIEQQARSNFEQKTLPSIAERFTSMGGQGSSAFQQMLGSASAGLEQNLAAMKQQYNLQREPTMQNYLRMGLTPRFDTNVKQHPGLFKSLAGPIGQGIGTGLSLLPFM